MSTSVADIADTVEEKMLEIQQRKQRMMDSVIGQGEKGVRGGIRWTEADLQALLS